VPPLAHAVGDGFTRLVDHEVDAALHQIRCGREPDWSSSDDRNGQRNQLRAGHRRMSQIDQRHAALQLYRSLSIFILDPSIEVCQY